MSRVPELSDTIFDALNEALPSDDDDSQVIWRVDVSDGWGSTLFVTVCSGIRRHDAGSTLAEDHPCSRGPRDGPARTRCPDHLGNLTSMAAATSTSTTLNSQRIINHTINHAIAHGLGHIWLWLVLIGAGIVVMMAIAAWRRA